MLRALKKLIDHNCCPAVLELLPNPTVIDAELVGKGALISLSVNDIPCGPLIVSFVIPYAVVFGPFIFIVPTDGIVKPSIVFQV